MASPNPAPSAAAAPPSRRWRRRGLWIAALLLSLLAVRGIWNRRVMLRIHSLGGRFETHAGQQRLLAVANWIEHAGGRLQGEPVVWTNTALRWTSHDADLRSVNLRAMSVDSEWLVHVRNNPSLESLALRSDQLGPGLRHLTSAPRFRMLSIESPVSVQLSDLVLVPPLKSLSLWKPPATGVDLTVLRELPALKWFHLSESPRAGEILRQLAELPHLTELELQYCGGVTADDWKPLVAKRKLRRLVITGSRILDDDTLEVLSMLPELRVFYIWRSARPLSERGLDAMTRFRKLRELSLGPADAPAEQVEALRERMPFCLIRAH